MLAYILPQRDKALLQFPGEIQVIDDFLVLCESVLKMHSGDGEGGLLRGTPNLQLTI